MSKTKESLANEWEVMEKEFSRTDDDWRDQILCFFDEGDNQSFYSKWNAHCSEDSTDSTNVRPLEFYLQLYFIVKNWNVGGEVFFNISFHVQRKKEMNDLKISVNFWIQRGRFSARFRNSCHIMRSHTFPTPKHTQFIGSYSNQSGLMILSKN